MKSLDSPILQKHPLEALSDIASAGPEVPPSLWPHHATPPPTTASICCSYLLVRDAATIRHLPGNPFPLLLLGGCSTCLAPIANQHIWRPVGRMRIRRPSIGHKGWQCPTRLTPRGLDLIEATQSLLGGGFGWPSTRSRASCACQRIRETHRTWRLPSERPSAADTSPVSARHSLYTPPSRPRDRRRLLRSST
jgi:hypothetical protein